MRRSVCLILCLLLLCPVVVQAEETEKYVALTFDDGPSGRFTRRLLKGLYDRNAKATFLLCGYRLKQYPDLAQQLLEEGHEIGIHGYSHANMASMTRKQIAKEIMDTEALLPKRSKVVFMRPPGGSISDGVRQVARARGIAVLDWSVDPWDWASDDAVAIGAAVVEKVHDGDIVLLHDMSDSSVDAALAIIDQLQSQGFNFVTVSRLAEIRGVKIQPGVVYDCFPPKS